MAGKTKAKGGPRGGSPKAKDKPKPDGKGDKGGTGGKDGKEGKGDQYGYGKYGKGKEGKDKKGKPDKKDKKSKGKDKGDHYWSDTVAIILKRDCAEALYAALVVALGTLPTPKKKKKKDKKKDKKDKGKIRQR
jgi:hypothetical protein